MMKTIKIFNMLLKQKALLAVLVLIITVFHISYGQEDVKEEEKSEPRFTFNYYKFSNGEKKLITNITIKGDEGYDAITQVPVSYFTFDDEGIEQLLGSVKTNDEGDAIYTLEEDAEFIKDSSNAVHFIARFDGNKNLTEVESEIAVRDVNIELTFLQKGENRSILLKANEVGPDGEAIPVEETDVFCYVPSMFGDLKIGEGWLENGEAVMDFPKHLPGDSSGNLIIIAKIEENENFGNVQIQEAIRWGELKPHVINQGNRMLWTPNAPTWMVVTLIILLGGVWSHFGYVIFKLYKIKKEGQDLKAGRLESIQKDKIVT